MSTVDENKDETKFSGRYSNIVLGRYRLTTGSGHVAGTDWVETRVATAAFSVL